MSPKHSMIASWYAVLALMFFSLYGWEAPRMLAHLVGAERAAAIQWSFWFVVAGILFALAVSGILIFFARRDFD